MADVIMVYPKAGTYGIIFKDLPLSLICASTILYNKGYEIKIIDQRIDKNWEKNLKKELDKNPLLVATSAMTGQPIKYALEISKFTKENSKIPVVWGGIHPTILPEQTLKNKYIDIIVRGEGEEIFYNLVKSLKNKEDISKIKGISYKKNGKIYHNVDAPAMNLDKLPQIPYGLVDVNKYIRNGWDEKIFSIQTSRGCPHRCGFCFSPAYSNRYWRGESVKKVMEHLRFIREKYNPDYIYFADNDFFVNMERAKELFIEIKKEKIDVIFGHRGLRIDEIKRMDNDFLKLMQDIGTRELHMGAESGSQRILDIMKKDMDVRDITLVNRRLIKFPGLLPFYNFFSGVPTETKEDIKKSTDLMLKILKENPRAQVQSFNQFTPYPGTSLYNLAKEYGFKEPTELEQWIDFDQGDSAKNCPWINKDRQKLMDMLYFTSFFIDKKMMHLNSKRLRFTLFRMLSNTYRPVARFRFKNHLTAFPIEVMLKKAYFKWVNKNL